MRLRRSAYAGDLQRCGELAASGAEQCGQQDTDSSDIEDEPQKKEPADDLTDGLRRVSSGTGANVSDRQFSVVTLAIKK